MSQRHDDSSGWGLIAFAAGAAALVAVLAILKLAGVLS